MAVERNRAITGHLRKVYLPFSEGPQAFYNDHDSTLAGNGRWVLDTVKEGELVCFSAAPNICYREYEAFAARHVAPLRWVSE